MDLRQLISSEGELEEARAFVTRGLLAYQPFIFSDALETGVGYEFVYDQEGAGLVHWPDIPLSLLESPDLARFIVDPSLGESFRAANARLRANYDHYVATVCSHLGSVEGLSVLDVGCNTGYFPLSFAKRGARLATGYDREDYSGVFRLLNKILGVSAKFVQRPPTAAGAVSDVIGAEPHDVVFSMMVLCHITDFFGHLSALAGLSKRVLFIWTLVSHDDDYSLRFGEPNKYYKDDPFPKCFDNFVRPSCRLLEKSLETLGYGTVIPVPAPPEGLPDFFIGTGNAAYLAIRR